MSVTINSGDSYLDRNKYLFLTKLDLNTARHWRAYTRSLTQIGCEVEIDGNRYWLTINVSADLSGFVQFKEINPAWLGSKLAQQRYAERAERLLPDRIFKAREKLIFDRHMELPLEERQKRRVDCCLVRYDDNDNHYRAHAHDRDYNEIHVSEFGSFFAAQRMLREWAVVHDVCYCGGYTRHDNPAQFQSFISAMQEHRVRGEAASREAAS